MIHLDSSFLVRLLVSGSLEEGLVEAWTMDGAQIETSAVAWTEFLSGPLSPDHQAIAAELIDGVNPFDAEDAALAARLFNASGRVRSFRLDCMIAATAINRDAALATSNPADFRRFESAGLEVLAP